MKLWIKLTVFITIAVNLIIQLALLMILSDFKENSYTLIGEKLKSVASTSALSIDGDEFQKLDFTDPLVTQSPIFNRIREKLKQTKDNLELKEDIYTLSSFNNNKVLFGVMTNPRPFTGDTLYLINKTALKAFVDAYFNNKCVYTELYEDQFGEWISGLAPILNSENQVVGVVQVDNSDETVSQKISVIENRIMWFRIILFVITVIFSFAISKYFVRPINHIVSIINNVVNGNYSEMKKIKAGGEIKELLNSAENLRVTILEQQNKIFNTIKELRNAKEKLETSDKMKSEFLALISHEIRTPLNVILGNIEILKLEMDEQAIEELSDITVAIKEGSTRLIRTVEMLVLYSELISGSYKKNETYVNVNNIFFDLTSKYIDEVNKKGIKIHYECTTVTGMIKADQRLLEETITQLTDNAVKFTESGEIHFCVFDKKEAGISLVFEDTGIGISMEFIDELFKPFRQEDMSYERKFEGNGMGLALAKKCCDFNGFDIKIDSEKNKGTVVEVIIPKEKLFNIQ